MKVSVVCMFVALVARSCSQQHGSRTTGTRSFPRIPASGDILDGRELARARGCVLRVHRFRRCLDAAQEAKNPKKDMPIGILGSLVICTVLYILVSGRADRDDVPDNSSTSPDPVVVRISSPGSQQWARFSLNAGRPGGTGQRDARDVAGPDPECSIRWRTTDWFALESSPQIHPKFRTPCKSSILVGTFRGDRGQRDSARRLDEMMNVGTLLAFVIV